MATIHEALMIAVRHHQAGQLYDAVRIYHQILELHPGHPDALHLLGVVAYQLGQFEPAVQYIQQAIAARGTQSEYHLNLGNALRDLGRREEALACYRKAVELDERSALAQSNLGVALQETGRLEEAIACYRRAVESNPGHARVYSNLGCALDARGETEEAIACHRRAVELEPGFAQGRFNLAASLQKQGNLEEAVRHYQRVLELRPADGVLCNSLGVALQGLGRLEEAIDFLLRARNMNPGDPAVHNNLGNAYQARGRHDLAIECYQRALELNPTLAQAHGNLGLALQEQGRLDEAIAAYRESLRLDPRSTDSLTHLGNALKEQGKLEEALECYQQVVELRPELAIAHFNIGNVLRDLGNLDESITAFTQAIELDPNLARARFNRAVCWLQKGEWERGWQEYQSRWLTPEFGGRSFSQPAWDGGRVAGKRLLLHAEQGLGDTIQFVRYARVFQARGATVILEAPPRLMSLLERCEGVDELVAREQPLPEFDCHVPLMNIPALLGTTVERVPAEVPYLHPRPELVEKWRDSLEVLDGFKVGICWQGSKRYREDRARSVRLEEFAPLATIPGVRLISLQQGEGTEQLAELKDRFAITGFGEELDRDGPFLDTAALMRVLDLVIVPDTALAHLAGALGARTWLMLSFAHDWRWLTERTDTPWYPTMRLFRQKQRGDWPSVFEAMTAALSDIISSFPARAEAGQRLSSG
jgi:tetratricopeptide (TPR) repeat protein